MFIFNSRSKLMVAGVLLLAASGASAADRDLDVVVQGVDADGKSLSVLNEESGEVRTYSFTGTPKVDVGGRKYRSLSVLEVGQNVTLKFKQEKPTENQLTMLKGEIQEINWEQGVALINPVNGGEAQLVALPQTVAVSGLRKGARIQDLKAGHFVTLKYSAR